MYNSLNVPEEMNKEIDSYCLLDIKNILFLPKHSGYILNV